MSIPTISPTVCHATSREATWSEVTAQHYRFSSAHCEHRFGLLGEFRVKALDDEEISRKNARRSLVAKDDLKAGQEVTERELTFKRPAYGISPRSIDELVGKKVLKDIPEDTVLQWNMFE